MDDKGMEAGRRERTIRMKHPRLKQSSHAPKSAGQLEVLGRMDGSASSKQEEHRHENQNVNG
jgi:hypothetical protein